MRPIEAVFFKPVIGQGAKLRRVHRLIVTVQAFFLKSPDETLDERFLFGGVRARPILSDMQGGKILFRFPPVFAAVRPCIHCGGCQKAPSCVFDDYAAIDSAFKTADVLAVASPVYGLGFPAPLKAVFDRTQQYFEAKFSRGVAQPIAKHKKALLFTASGSDNPKAASFMEEELRLVLKIVNAELCGVVSVLNTDRAAPGYERLAGEIAEIIAYKLGPAEG